MHPVHRWIAGSLDHASTYAVDSSGSMLNGVRRAGVCVFPDGSAADKQFVMGMNIRDDGSAGDAVGISIYTFESGDSLTLSFTGGWDKSPFSGEYTVLSNSVRNLIAPSGLTLFNWLEIHGAQGKRI